MSSSTESSNSSSINNACHTALECTDILLLIFDHLGGTEPYEDGFERIVDTGTYACCARVCRAFYEPATRMLWAGLRSLSQLFYILRVNPIVPTLDSFYDRPASAVASDQAYYAAILEEKPYLDPDLWQRFMRHASLVRALCFLEDYEHAENEGELCLELMRHNNGQPFLPFLQQLIWSSQSRNRVSHDLHTLISCVGPLQGLCIIFSDNSYNVTVPSEDDTRAMDSIVRFISTHSPSLRKLKFKWDGRPAAHRSELSLMRNLRSLDTYYSSIVLGPLELRVLLTSTPLERMQVRVEGFSAEGLSAAPLQARSLQELNFMGTCRDLAGIMAYIHAPALKTITMGVSDQHYMALSDFCTCVRRAASQSTSLRKLHVNIPDPQFPPRPRPAPIHMLWSDILRPCFALPELDALQLELVAHRYALSMDDDDARLFAQAMPRLRIFFLHASCGEARLPTPRALLYFATHCPLLEQLEFVGLEGGPIPECNSAVAPTPTQAHPLLWLWFTVARTPVEDPQKFVAYLLSLFPSVDIGSLRQRSFSNPEAVSSWDGICSELSRRRYRPSPARV